MYLMNIIRNCGISLPSCVISLFMSLGIFTFANTNASANVICQDGCDLNNINVEFKGIYQEGTCAISINGALSEETVILPTISYQTLSSAGNEAGATKFTVTLNNCPTNVEVLLFFKSYNNNLSPATENLKNDTGAGLAANVELRLRDEQFNHIKIDNQFSGQVYTIPGANSSVVKSYYVSYFSGANAVSPGNVRSRSVLEVVYK
ncbi:fimbrial protein [Morganella morganii]|uniref:fimbrial protein n=1 Tax=Morganella morganii TaxID=582 RepID=UPI0034D6803C